MPGYTEATIIVEGALSEVLEIEPDTETVTAVTYGGPGSDEGTKFSDVLDALKDEADRKGFRAEVFTLWHEHEPDAEGEDDCAQYATDNNPAYVYGPESS